VINIGSIAGREIYPGGNVYCATKAAVGAITKGMIIDLNGTGVRVTNIELGLVETEFANVRFHGDEEKAKTVYQGYIPLTGRDVAETALFCATRPQHVMIQDILITPTDQATSSIVNKKL
jgi:3-hydroxy acid dehydrogenase / malonic semialdehyde reductase